MSAAFRELAVSEAIVLRKSRQVVILIAPALLQLYRDQRDSQAAILRTQKIPGIKTVLTANQTIPKFLLVFCFFRNEKTVKQAQFPRWKKQKQWVFIWSGIWSISNSPPNFENIDLLLIYCRIYYAGSPVVRRIELQHQINLFQKLSHNSEALTSELLHLGNRSSLHHVSKKKWSPSPRS